jgi:5-(carboxyamino)imidazole ribonucleotide mutase
VPMASGPMAGVDAALSTMQMPNGIPVGCMAVGAAGAANAAIFATQILALADPALEETMKQHKQTLIEKTIQRDQELQDTL